MDRLLKPGMTVAVVGDGAVLLAVLSAKQMGTERHESRQKLALEFGATDMVTERGEEEPPASRK